MQPRAENATLNPEPFEPVNAYLILSVGPIAVRLSLYVNVLMFLDGKSQISITKNQTNSNPQL